jgi:hypothetical protein
MGRDLAIALATIAGPILGGLIARWEPILSTYRGSPYALIQLGVTLLCLVVAVIGGALVAADSGTDPPEAFVLAQMFGVVWGSEFLVGPPLLDLAAELRKSMPERAWRVFSVGLSISIGAAASCCWF